MTVQFEDAIWEQVTNANSTQYTAPADCTSAQIISAICANEDASNSSLTVNLVQSGDSVAVTNRYFPTETIVAGATNGVSSIVGAILMPGDFVSAIAGDNDRLNLKLGIKEIYGTNSRVRYQDAVWEQVTALDTSSYTAPTDCKSARIIYANCTNEDASATTLTVNIVQSGGSVAVTNRYFTPSSILGGTYDPVSEIVGSVLKPGDQVSAIAGAAARLNLKLGIKEIY